MIPTLHTDRLTLRAPAMADFDAYAAFYASDRAAGTGGTQDLKQAFRSFAAIPGHWFLKGFGWWMIDLGGRAIGFTGVHNPPNKADTELGWVLFTGFERQGFAREAATAALAYARTRIRPDRLVSYIIAGNRPSERLAGALGATPSGPADHDPRVTVWAHAINGDAA